MKPAMIHPNLRTIALLGLAGGLSALCADAAPGAADGLERTGGTGISYGVDFRNDDELPPHAFNLPSGSLGGDHEARFKVYRIYRDADFGDITSDFADRVRVLKVKVRPAPGSRSVAGRIYYDRDAKELVYVPRRAMRLVRTAVFSFEFRWAREDTPTFFTYTLEIPAAR